MCCCGQTTTPPVPACTPPAITVQFPSTNAGIVPRLDITAFTGGLPNCLDDVLISPFQSGTVLQIQIGGVGGTIRNAQKTQTTSAPVAGSIITPPDYNAITNPFQWLIIS